MNGLKCILCAWCARARQDGDDNAAGMYTRNLFGSCCRGGPTQPRARWRISWAGTLTGILSMMPFVWTSGGTEVNSHVCGAPVAGARTVYTLCAGISACSQIEWCCTRVLRVCFFCRTLEARSSAVTTSELIIPGIVLVRTHTGKINWLQMPLSG